MIANLDTLQTILRNTSLSKNSCDVSDIAFAFNQWVPGFQSQQKKNSMVSFDRALALLQANMDIDFDTRVVVARRRPSNIDANELGQNEQLIADTDYVGLLKDTVGSVPPYWNRRHFLGGVFRRPLAAMRILYKLRRNPQKPPPYFWPSTGMMALALAVRSHQGADAHFVVSGMTFKARDVHAIHGDVSSAKSWFAAHVIADMYCLHHLQQRHKISVL